MRGAGKAHRFERVLDRSESQNLGFFHRISLTVLMSWDLSQTEYLKLRRCEDFMGCITVRYSMQLVEL
jgi:hypothetical protein